jgi:WD40-like Beta Propeller Repeat
VRTTTRQQATWQPLVRFPILVGLVLVFALGAAACSAISATRTSPDQPGPARIAGTGTAGRHRPASQAGGHPRRPGRLPRRPRCSRTPRPKQGAGWRPPAMSRPGRLLAWGSLAALLVLSGCTSAMTGSPTAGRLSAAAPSTGPASARPGRVRLHGRVALASDRRRNVDLYLLELPAGRLRRLASSPAADLSPTWAPDGGRLAFRSDRDGNDEVSS